jgi:EmrB/QacA subfamily drug resistance transporter
MSNEPQAIEVGEMVAQPYQRRWWMLGVLCLSLLVIALDNTILNVALPTLARDLSATGSELQWIVDAYVLVFAGLLLTAGAIGDRFGRKRALFGGFLVFAVGATLAGFSTSTEQLIAMRAVMGVGGAFIMPATLSILTNVFPSHERPRAIAIWAAMAGIGVPLGPIIGGWLLNHFDWGSVFFVNLPVIAVAVAAGAILIPDSKDPEETPLDPVGAVLSIGGLASLLYGIIEAPSEGWTSTTSLVAFTAAAVLLALFAAWELSRVRPMLDLKLFRNPSFTGASLAIALTFFALFGSLFFITQYLQFVLGYTPLEAGIRVAPVAIGIVLGTGASTRFRPRIGTRLTVAGGMLIVAAGLFLLSTATDTSGYERLLVALLVLATGMGLAMAPATNSIMGAVPKEHAGVGSAVNDTTRQVGGALGVAILGSILSTAYGSNLGDAAAGLPPSLSERARDSIGETLQVAAVIGGDQGSVLIAAAHNSFISAMDTTLHVAAAFALAGSLVALVVLPSRRKEADTESESMGRPREQRRAARPPRLRNRT